MENFFLAYLQVSNGDPIRISCKANEWNSNRELKRIGLVQDAGDSLDAQMCIGKLFRFLDFQVNLLKKYAAFLARQKKKTQLYSVHAMNNM